MAGQMATWGPQRSTDECSLTCSEYSSGGGGASSQPDSERSGVQPCSPPSRSRFSKNLICSIAVDAAISASRPPSNARFCNEVRRGGGEAGVGRSGFRSAVSLIRGSPVELTRG